jgi:hypothetical protein
MVLNLTSEKMGRGGEVDKFFKISSSEDGTWNKSQNLDTLKFSFREKKLK